MIHIQSISNSEFIILFIFKEDNKAPLNIFVYYNMLFVLSVSDLYYNIIVLHGPRYHYHTTLLRGMDLAINYDICQFSVCA